MSGFASRVHRTSAPPHAILAPVTIPPDRGVTVTDAILPCRRLEPRKRSRSTAVAIPSTLPVAVHCQYIQPWPPQSCAGTSGSSTPQWAIHSGCPFVANHVVSPRYVRQKYGLEYTIGRTPVRVWTRVTHVRTQSCISRTDRPLVSSMSSTGITSPASIRDTSTNQSASS